MLEDMKNTGTRGLIHYNQMTQFKKMISLRLKRHRLLGNERTWIPQTKVIGR